MERPMRNTVPVIVAYIQLDPHAKEPRYAGANAAGADLFARIAEPIVIPPLGRAKIPTGLAIELPQGYEAQVRPRSGLAFKHGVTVINAPGTIDSDYRGEVAVLLVNLGPESYTVHDGDRIAQFVVAPVSHVEFQNHFALSETERGSGGFGSTGV